ncbi:MAG: flagellar motor switch protein FliN [Candidatus Hydrogenedentes bacterium]|nr:flagellar motor switch protein FliN [Candidatus Hydrogenedentota bacterium]
MSQDEVNAMLKGLGPNADSESDAVAAPAASRDDTGAETKNLDMVLDIRLTATARLGRVDMQIADILSLGPGSIIEVGHLVDEPVELLVNDKLIARGDVVVVDEKFGLRITEIISPRERIESLR